MTTLNIRRSLAAAALSSLAMTGLVACGDSGSDTAADPAGASSSTPSSSPSETASDVQAGDSVTPADFTALMASGFENITTAHVTLESKAGMTGGMTGEGDVDYTGDSPATSMTLSSDSLGGDLKAVLVDGVMYMNLGQLSDDKFWKLDLNAKDSPFGALGSQLDPKSSMDLLEKGLDSVTYVGQEDVDGQSLDHYKATVDPASLLKELGSTGAGGAAGLPKSFAYDIWLDDQHRLTKLTLDMGSIGSTTTELSDWDKDVSIEAPPADQVTKMPDMPGMTDSGGSASGV
ncbi:LppX_LprAFG lipoprotein [Nocardioides sp. CN2-186]|uniref:LppX_LprAFG lipoprotein n=1 Tax=Nocardioides tweenelious TaxID=3156607 RepID=UPI0032B376D5